MQGIETNGHENMTVDLSDAIAQDGQIIITGEDGQGTYIFVIIVILQLCKYADLGEFMLRNHITLY